jgi:hypothetical protein
MWTDPIVEEVRRRRHEYAAAFNYDLRAICRAARQKQQEGDRQAVVRPPRPVARCATTNREPVDGG